MSHPIYRRIRWTDPRLKRYVLHDPQSWRYRFPTEGLKIASVEHKRILPILDQGNVGSCTAECGFGVLGTEPYYSTVLAGLIAGAFGSFDQAGAYRLYNAEENLDGDGPYPPQDNGSTGLTLAKALRAAGLVAGWTQTFAVDDALKALTLFPLATGTLWFNSMFNPGPDGVIKVDPSSGVAGGHEWEVRGYDEARGLIKMDNSWSPGWGLAGSAFMQAEDWDYLLHQEGDVTVLTPLEQPAPTPTPVPVDAATAALAAAMRHNNWVGRPHCGGNAAVARAGKPWLAELGL